MISLSEASFEELRDLGLSVTQAKRIIKRRDERGGFTTIDELDDIPGFPKDFLADIKRHLVP
jgi:DNA uptake protein ComE-like DNA-binding protein